MAENDNKGVASQLLSSKASTMEERNSKELQSSQRLRIKHHGMHTAFPESLRLLWWLRQQRVCLQRRRPRFDPWVRKIPWRRE